MKRVISLLFALCVCLTSFSQLPKSLLGVQLDKSTRSQVENIVTSNNLKIISSDNNKIYCQLREFELYNQSWENIIFNFNNGKVKSIFVTKSSQFPLFEEFESLQKKLDYKYGKYLAENKEEFNGDISLIYDDNTSLLNLSYIGKNVSYHDQIFYLILSIASQKLLR